MNRLGWSVVVVIVVAAGFFALFWKPEAASEPARELSPAANQILLTEDGFTPDRLTIQKGETVTFSTNRGKIFWPASNLHPSHLEYAAFDPKEPIAEGSAWSFTFDQPGEWKYHDHLAPYFTGTITVVE